MWSNLNKDWSQDSPIDIEIWAIFRCGVIDHLIVNVISWGPFAHT